MSGGWSRRLWAGGVGVAFLAGAVMAGSLSMPGASAQQQESRYAVEHAPPASAGVANLQSLSEAFASVAETVKPSVVYIKSGKNGGGDRSGDDQPQLPPGFEQFFPRFRMQPQFEEAAGSGFIVSRDGYILTNDHVVDGSDQVTVRLLDRREFKAKVVREVLTGAQAPADACRKYALMSARTCWASGRRPSWSGPTRSSSPTRIRPAASSAGASSAG